MKLIQALNELKLIKKKIDQNAQRIGEYASACSMNLKLETEDAQRTYLAGLIQSSLDLVKRYSEIKIAIEKTNLATIVDTEYGKYSLVELLLLRGEKGKTGLADWNRSVYQALTDRTGDTELQKLLQSSGYDKENPQKSLRFYDPKQRDEKITYWTEFRERIDGIIEVTNASTDLME